VRRVHDCKPELRSDNFWRCQHSPGTGDRSLQRSNAALDCR
jgi:hypothetical protein